MDGQVAATLDEASTRALVEQAVLRDEAAPLLRILFEVSTAAAEREQEATAAAAHAAQAAAAAAAVPQGPGTSAANAAAAATSTAAAAAAAVAAIRRQQAAQDASGQQTLALISKTLHSLASEQEQAIKEICHTHAREITGCVEDVHAMPQGVAAVQGLLVQSSHVLKEAGLPLQSTAHSLAELLAVRGNVEDGLVAVRAAAALLRQLLQVGQLLDSRQLDGALQLIQDLQKTHLVKLMEVLDPSNAIAAPAETASNGNQPTPDVLQAKDTAAASGKQLANVVSLRAFFDSILMELLAAVEALAITEMHGWLMSARDQARAIGLRAVRKAAIARQFEDDLARERLSVQAQLAVGAKDIDELSEAAAVSQFRRELATERTVPGSQPGQNTTAPAALGEQVISLNSVLQPGQLNEYHDGEPHTAVAALIKLWGKQQRRKQTRHAAAKPTSGLIAAHDPGILLGIGAQLCVNSDVTTPLLAGLNMQGLLGCLHIHKALGRIARLREYYVEQRRLQLAADLAAPQQPFLEHYQPYIGQVVGFFVIEAAVARLMPELATSSATGLLWEGTATQVKTVLERALCTSGKALSSTQTQDNQKQASTQAADSQAPSIMVLVKDFVLLAGDALDNVGCSPAALQDVLVAASPRYHELILAPTLAEANKLLANDNIRTEYLARSTADAHHLCITLGLPYFLDIPPPTSTAELPPAPFKLPFTQMVPGLLKLIRSYVQDSVAYIRGLVNPWETETAAMQFRDSMVQRLVSDCIMPKISSVAAADQLLECMRLVAGAWAWTQCTQAMDVHLQVAAAPKAEQDAEVQKWAHKAKETASNVKSFNSQQQEADNPVASSFKGKKKNGRNNEAVASAIFGGGTLPPTLTSSFQLVLDTAQRALLRLVSRKLDAILTHGFKTMSWMPTTYLDSGPSEHIPKLIAFLQEVYDLGLAALPRACWSFLVSTTLKSVALSYLKLFSPDSIVKGYNLVVIERLQYDISALQNFAARLTALHSSSRVIGSSIQANSSSALQSHQPLLLVGLVQQFSEASQLFQLLLSPKLEDILDPEYRKKRFPDIEPATILLALDKYRELTRIGKDKTPYPTRKQVEDIIWGFRCQTPNHNMA